MATVTLKNKGFSLQALKVAKNSQGDATDKVLENARFALYRQVSTISGMVKDQNPMEGYEALTTGADGIIPKITSALPPGTYYLTETNPPDGCKPLEGDLVFTISADGVVSIPSRVTSADPQDLIILNNLPDIGADEWISQEEEDGNGAHVHGTGRKGLRAPVEREVLGNLGQVGLPGLLKKGVCL